MRYIETIKMIEFFAIKTVRFDPRLLLPDFLMAASTVLLDNARRSFLFFELVITKLALRLACCFLPRTRFLLEGEGEFI
jgi:hypothetical protein